MASTSDRARSVCVVGTLHQDFVVRASRFPVPGETLKGESYETFPGGKGANQAVAASRMGARVVLLGAIGEDDQGRAVRGALASEGIDLTHIRTVSGVPTGIGFVTVVPGGENMIVVAPGADMAFSPEDVERASGAIAEASVLLLQGELRTETTLRAMEVARKSNTLVIYNAAPVCELPEGFLAQVDVLVCNRGEASGLLGDEAAEVGPAGLVRRLTCLGPERVVLTVGEEGAFHYNGSDLEHCEAFTVEALDSTGSGDAFCGALAVQLAEGERLRNAVRFACAAGSLASTESGALPSLPTRDEVEVLARKKDKSASAG